MTELEQYYTAKEAAIVLSRNSGKEVQPSYIRVLARYGKLTPTKVDDRRYLYLKAEVDAYVVESRGEKSGRASHDRSNRASSKK